MSPSNKWFWIYSIILLAIGSVLSLFVGSVDIPFSRIFGSSELSEFESIILYESRFPRTLTAIIGGAGLSLAGLMMQTLFRNPLAGPSVLGISSGASLAVAFVTLGAFGIQASALYTVSAAIAGSIGVLLIILWVARKFVDITTVLIVGLMLSFFTSSIVSLLQSFASEASIKSFVFWGFGSFSDVSLSQLPYFAVPVLLVLLVAPFFIKGLNAFLMGALHAKSMGYNPKTFQMKTILSAGVVAGTVTAFCGPIAFVGFGLSPYCPIGFLKQRIIDSSYLGPFYLVPSSPSIAI